MREHISGTYTIKQIFEDDRHWEQFCEEHPHLRQNIIDEVDKVLRCNDPAQSGYHTYACPDHPWERIVVPHTCKSRFCSRCGKIMTDQWIERAMEQFLDVPYHHIVFTMPDKLWNIFPYDRKLLNVLFIAAEQTVLEWCREKGGYVPGVVCVLHTFGSVLNFNTHIHMLITEGGLSSDRTSWVPNEFIPWKMLKDRWKYWILELLEPEVKQLIQQGWIEAFYRELGVGDRFLHLLEDASSQNMVRVDGMHPV